MSLLPVGALVLVLLGSASAWDSSGPDLVSATKTVSKSDVSRRDISLCFERARSEGAGGKVLSDRLARLGEPVFSALFELGLRGTWEGETESKLRLNGDAERDAVFDALCAFPAGTLHKNLNAVGPLLLEDAGRLYGLKLLLRVGGAAEIDDALLVASYRSADDETPASARSVTRRVRMALKEFLIHSFDVEEELTRAKVIDKFTTAPLALTATLVEALGEQRGRRNFFALAELLQHRPEVDPFLLVSLSKDSEGILLPVPDRVRSRVRSTLEGAKSNDVRALSLRLLGRLEDEESIPRFLRDLVSEDRVLSDAALDALRSCTGRKFGRNPRSWEGWLRSENRWWDELSADIFAEVCDGKGGAITRSIQAIAHRRLHRHELARQIECVLRREESTLVILGCATLGHLGSWDSLPPLIRLMETTSNPEIVQATHEALMKITDLSPPMESEAWRLLMEREL